MKANRVSIVAPWLAAALLLLGGCVGPTGAPPPAPPPSVPRPAPTAQPATPPPADWRDAPQTAGTWRWSAATGRSTASYGLPAASPVASLSCTSPGETILWTSSEAAGPVPLVVTTTSTRRLLTAEPVAGGGVAVLLPARDPLLDAMAFSRGRFMIEVAGFPALYLPAWPEVSRVIEDCR
ncbi:MAG: hypothetical protein KGL54_03365 [Sphingomonadales bacterium]|nr:hypothetical protein [Sphingomonadales bacterium]